MLGSGCISERAICEILDTDIFAPPLGKIWVDAIQANFSGFEKTQSNFAGFEAVQSNFGGFEVVQ